MKQAFAFGFTIFTFQIITSSLGDPISQTTDKTQFGQTVYGSRQFIARIYDGEGKSNSNGILISQNFVLTIVTNSSAEHVTLEDSKGTGNPKSYDVIDFETDTTNTIELLKLNESVKFGDFIRPAYLSQQSYIPKQLIGVGWGNRVLHQVKFILTSNVNCKDTFAARGNIEINDGRHFCAAAAESHHDFCSGFGGAALLNEYMTILNYNEIIGIVLSPGCGKDPSIFVRLTDYIDWIEAIVWSNETTTSNTLAGSGTMTTTERPDLVNISDDVRRIVIIAMLFVTFVLLCICITLFLCIHKYKMKNRRSLGDRPY